MTTKRLQGLTTAELIARYEELTARRYNGGRRDGGYDKRRDQINRVVDELAARDDRDDPEARAFFDKAMED